MSTQSDKLPPVPQLTVPFTTVAGVPRFENAWLQWFIELKIKVDTINAALISASKVTGAGLVVQAPDGSWVTRTIQGTPGQISVANGDGVAGNPVINYIGSGGGGGGLTLTQLTANFGAAPGKSALRLTVLNAAITGTSTVLGWFTGTTTDHNAEEHAIVTAEFNATDIVPGVSFVLLINTDLRLTGNFNVAYAIIG